MAAIFDSSDPASPLAYNASQTALLLMDFQTFIVDRVEAGKAAMDKAVKMRDWARQNDVMVVHCVVDVQGVPPATKKGAQRLTEMLTELAKDKSAIEEPTEIAFSQADDEYIVLKQPGVISALKSKGAVELLKEHNIQSLILCGLSTSGVVLRTALPATDDGFVVSVIEDACADPKEDLHETLMKSVLPSRAHVTNVGEFLEQWEKQAVS
jgi:nicotinamidase-related amidase